MFDPPPEDPACKLKPDPERLYGLELEFGSLTARDCGNAIQDCFGGTIHGDRHTIRIENTDLGDFSVKLDSSVVTDTIESIRPASDDRPGPWHAFRTQSADALQNVSEWMIPVELSFPPIPYHALPAWEKLRQKLQTLPTAGTRSAIHYAFGLHLNFDIAAPTSEYLLRVLRAFLICYPWLKQEGKIDFTRRLLTFIDPYPDEYVQFVLDPDYEPDRRRFFEDYAAFNPTRNRALDLLPLLQYLEPEAASSLDERTRSLIQPRPAFHYRLPNCEIDNPDWSIAAEWNRWMAVERLASRPDQLAHEAGRCRSDPHHILAVKGPHATN